MLTSEIPGIQYLAPEIMTSFPNNIGVIQNNIHIPFLHNLPNSQNSPPLYELSPGYVCLSNNSTSDEAEEHQISMIIDERKRRRMISNRESARRSRMRKQKHLDELGLQVVRLWTENHQLIEQLNHVSESHERLVLENAKLKEEASELRGLVTDLQIRSPYSGLGELDDHYLQHSLSQD